jgi:hypothetical protein
MSATGRERARKLNLILAGVVGILLVVVVVGHFVLGKGDVFDKHEATAAAPLFPGLDKSRVARLTIQGPKEEVDLKRKSETEWAVASAKKKVEGKDEWKTSSGDRKADQAAVDAALREITELPQGRIASSRNERLDAYDLDEKKRIHVTAKGTSDEVLAEFYLGKAGDNFSSCFVKKTDEDGVRRLDKNLRYVFDKSDREGWRDRTILTVDDQTKIDGFVVQGADRTVKLVKKPKAAEPADAAKPEQKEGEAASDPSKPPEAKDEWEIVEPLAGPVESFTADSLKRAVAPLTADSFYEGDKKPAELGLDPPEFTVTVNVAGKEPVVFQIGKDEESKRYVRVPGQDTIYQLSSYRVGAFTKEPKDFLSAAAKKALEEKEKAAKEQADKDNPPAAPEGEKKPEGGGSSGEKPADQKDG